MMIYWLYALCALYGLFKGIDEGIDMYLPNPRQNALFRWYHWFPIGRDVCSCAIGAMLFVIGRGLLKIDAALLTASAVMAAWELCEIAYSFMRYGIFLPNAENFLGLNVYLSENSTRIVHGLRIAAMITLIIGGVYGRQ